MTTHILLADDDNAVRRVIQFKLEKKGFNVTAVEDGRKALDQLHTGRFDLLLADIRMPEIDGLELLQRIQKTTPDLKVILITAHATVSQAVEAVKLGAFDYITKPFADEELFVAIDKALAFNRLENENRRLKDRLRKGESKVRLIGVSESFRTMLDTIEKVAETDATILITGASGTGKELVARTIHQRSRRTDNEFVAVNCAAIPRELLESELFGHVKGAFTGAVKNKKGKFELADGGTLFLDEISELAIELQAKLLRVLQERAIEPVGSEIKTEIDTRIVAATNVNLKVNISNGKFREDLFYRLNVIPIHVPLLRDRQEDIPVLIKVFLNKFGGQNEIGIDVDLIKTLTEYDWPGNIRELENLIERLVILRQSNILNLADLPEDFGQTESNRTKLQDDLRAGPLSFQEAEQNLILEALDKCGWNRTRAAKYISVPRHVLIYRMKKYNITAR